MQLPLGHDQRTGVLMAVAATLAVVVAVGGALEPDRLWVLAVPVAAMWAWAGGLPVPPWALAVVAAVAAVAVNAGEPRAEGAFFVTCAAVLAVAVHGRHRPTAHVVAAAAALSPLAAEATMRAGARDWGWPYWITGVALTWFMGEVLHRQIELTEALRRAQAQLVDQAAVAERQRIARELHDLLGHSLTVVLLHVTGARRLIRRDPAEAEAGLVQAEAVGRQALSEVRAVVTLLRSGDDDGAPAPDGGDVGRLVAASRQAGLDVREEHEVDLSRIGGAAGLAVYRVVQEGLANAARHGGHGPVRLSTRRQGDGLHVVVTNPLSSAPADGTATAPGTGLIGMRERTHALGGDVTAGPHGGMWRVEATVPINGGWVGVEDRDPARTG